MWKEPNLTADGASANEAQQPRPPLADLSNAAILLVDDNTNNLQLLRETLRPEGYRLFVADSGARALEIASKSAPELIVLDVLMPDMDGYEVCRRLRAVPATASIPIVFVTARDATADIVAGFRQGGVDYVVKPFSAPEVRARVRTHLERGRLLRLLEQRNRELEREMTARAAATAERNTLSERLAAMHDRETERWGVAGFVGGSSTIRHIIETVQLLQHSDSVAVLITGESGTGKELIARAVHHGSARAGAPFVPVNCSAIPSELAESLLFGHVRGAFTGADSDRPGLFALADGGTLFLDEIGDMDLALQAKLLRVLEDGVVTPVGATAGKSVNVRLVTATNVDLAQRVTDSHFRQDLYFRIAGFPVTLPPLRERTGDIAVLAEHFLRYFASEMGVDPPSLTAAARQALESYHYPGNVRELKNLLERALIEARGTAELGAEHLRFLFPPKEPATAASSVGADAVPLKLQEAERFLIARALQLADGNVSAAARMLGTNRTRIYRVLRGRHPR